MGRFRRPIGLVAVLTLVCALLGWVPSQGPGITTDVAGVKVWEGATELVSADASGANVVPHNTSAASTNPIVSGNGRFVVFASMRPLVSGDANNSWDVYVRDRQTGAMERISVSDYGGQGGGFFPQDVSHDGRFVLFLSASSDLVMWDTNGVADLFLRDRLFERTHRASVSWDGSQLSAGATGGAVSDDGQHVFFGTCSDEVMQVATRPGAYDVFRRHLPTGQVAWVTRPDASVAPDPAPPGCNSNWEPIDSTSDGQGVVFTARLLDLVAGTTSRSSRVYYWLPAGGVEHITTLWTSGVDVGSGFVPRVTPDGRWVVFGSQTGFNGMSGRWRVWVHDRGSGSRSLASVRADGSPIGQSTWAVCGYWPNQPAISADGRFVAFTCNVPVGEEVVPGYESFGPDQWAEDVFVRDLVAGRTFRASLTSEGRAAEYPRMVSPAWPPPRELPGGLRDEMGSSWPSISADGRLVAFHSAARLVPEDGYYNFDAYVRDTRASSPVSIVQSDSGSYLPGGEDPLGWRVATRPGSLLVASVSVRWAGEAGAVVWPAGYELGAVMPWVTSGGKSASTYLFYREGAPSESGSLSFVFGKPVEVAVGAVAEFSGVATKGALDEVMFGSGVGSVASSGQTAATKGSQVWVSAVSADEEVVVCPSDGSCSLLPSRGRRWCWRWMR